MPNKTITEILTVKNITFGYKGNTIFDNVSFTISKGDMVGIVGGNGSGKTTLIKLILGLLKPDKGEIKWSLESEQDGNMRGRVEYIAQDVAHAKTLLPTSVEEVVETGTYFSSMKNHKHIKNECCYDSVKQALDHVGISHLCKERINELSGGQRQRVFIARALIAHPEVLIMDEPFAGVDSETQEQLLILLDHLNKIHNITVIMISHNQEEVKKFMRTVILMKNQKESDQFSSQYIIQL